MLPYGRLNPYPSHYKTAFASSTILYPQPHRLALRLAFPMGELRAYHVPPVCPRGLGPSSTPGVLHLRQMAHEHLYLPPYLLVQASRLLTKAFSIFRLF
jgi:hypothetical protein